MLLHLVGIGFQVLFHSPHRGTFHLSLRFTRGFTCPVLLRNSLGPCLISVTGMSPSLSTLSKVFTYHSRSHDGVLQPRRQRRRFGLVRFRSPLLTESNSLSIPLLTKMFQFSRFCVSFLILFRKERYRLSVSGYPIQKSPGQRLFAPYRSLSQLITSFIAF